MRRREFIGLVGGATFLWPLVTQAQQPGKIARIGYLAPNLAAIPYQPEAFRRGLRDLGWVEGHNILIEYRDAGGKPERLPALAAELVALKVDLIVAVTTFAILAAKQATTTIPIVFPITTDPVGSGLVASLARPGGNVTGLSNQNSDTVGKCLDLLLQAVPKAGLVAVLWLPEGRIGRIDMDMREQLEVVATRLGTRLQFFEARAPDDFNKVFADMVTAGVSGLVVMPNSLFNQQRDRLAALAAAHRIPTSSAWREFVEAGGLMSYGPNLADMFGRSAIYVDRILKGAKPADLPVQQPTKFELVLNLKAAKALGLTIPTLVLAQADEVIE